MKEIPAIQPGQCRALVVAGADRRLSDVRADIAEIKTSKRFSKIYYEAMDVRIPGVDVIPMGMDGIFASTHNPHTHHVSIAYWYTKLPCMGFLSTHTPPQSQSRRRRRRRRRRRPP